MSKSTHHTRNPHEIFITGWPDCHRAGHGTGIGHRREKLAYALGAIVGERIYQDFGEVDYDALVEGVKSAANPEERLLSREEVGQVLQQAQQALQERAQLEQQAAGEATRVPAKPF